ncbi:MAG: hypothetical protein PVJ76_03740 [Gemmatimonadota bacterium]
MERSGFQADAWTRRFEPVVRPGAAYRWPAVLAPSRAWFGVALAEHLS